MDGFDENRMYEIIKQQKKMSKKVKIALASFIPFCLLIYFLTVCSG